MTTKLWGQPNYKDAERDTCKMRVCRSLKTVVQLLFKLRWPQKNNHISSLEHSSTSGATTPAINTWWATSSLLISPFSQMAIIYIRSRLFLFLCWIHPPFPIPTCSFLSYLRRGEVLLEEQLGCLKTRSPSGSWETMLFFVVWAEDDLELRKWIQRNGAVGVRGSAHMLLLSMNRKSKIPGKGTHLKIIN